MDGFTEFKDCEVRRMKLADLRPAEYNPRKMTDEARQGLGQSINRFGLLIPIVWNETSGNIVGGHQRYEHLKATGETETDVVVVNLDTPHEVALNIALNSGEIRGDFTKEVVGLLEMSEAQIGSAFKELGLMDLHEMVKKLKGKDTKKKELGSETDSPKSKDDDDPDPYDGMEPKAVITCPKCKSKWRMNDNVVILNAVLPQQAPEDDNGEC